MDREAKHKSALEMVGKAYQLQMQGEVDKAILLYSQSLDIEPTAEAFTYRGWARSFRKDFQGAIADCHQAIDLDPEFGNPYNDIGAYYLEMGAPEDAIPWLRMALKAKRYENTCFPHYNLGRIHEGRGEPALARAEYQAALAQNPGYAPAAKALERLDRPDDPAPGDPE